MNNRIADSAYAPSLSLFAQLLADENIITRVDPAARTASFEPVNRVLTLPSWQNLPEAVWLFLVAHEVGHARFTPKTAFQHPTMLRLEKQYGQMATRTVANLIEDVRIERLIRKQYPGLSGVFSRGYHALLSQLDFFKTGFPITPETWAKLSPLDRINIYAKVGALARVSLAPNGIEAEIYNLALAAETFDDVMNVVEAVMVMLPNKRQRQPQPNATGQSAQSGQSGQQGEQGQSQDQDGQSGQSQDQDGESNESGQSGESDEDGQSGQSSASGDSDEDDSDTASSSQSGAESDDASDDAGDQSGDGAEEDSDDNVGGSPQTPDGIGSSHFDEDPFACNTQAAADRNLQNASSGYSIYGPMMLPSNTDYMHANDVLIEDVLKAWKIEPELLTFLNGIVQQSRREQTTVLASMVSAFRANQAAWCARRVQTSKTGSIDPTRLANYKLTDDLFLRRLQRPDAQNHGFVLHVDWSSSMQYSLPVVLWQVLHLIWFAEQVNVPVEVWAFSDTGASTPTFTQSKSKSRTESRLIQLYSSRLRGADRLAAQSLLLSLALSFAGLTSHVGTVYYDYYTVESIKSRLPKSMHGVLDVVTKDAATRPAAWRQALTHRYLPLGGTPLYAGIVASVDTVRKFRKTYRIEQCISVWLTDGEDTDRVMVTDPATGQYDKTRFSREAVVIDPRSGRTFKNDREQAMWFDYHRTLTGATVVVIDISSTPLRTFGRVLSQSELKSVASRIMPEETTTTRRGRFGRRRLVTVRNKGPKQSRKNLIFGSAESTFDDAGLAIITRQQFPSMGIDAYIVTHTEWWSDIVQTRLTAAVDKATKKISESLKDDDGTATMTGTDRVRLSTALKSQHQTVAMRKFTGLLVPYMAAGRADGTV